MPAQDDVITQAYMPNQAASRVQKQSGRGCFQPDFSLWNVPGVCQLRDSTETGIFLLILMTNAVQITFCQLGLFGSLVCKLELSFLTESLHPCLLLAHEQQETQRAFGWEARQSEVHPL